MITLYREANDASADRIEARLHEMVAAYRTTLTDARQVSSVVGRAVSLPAITDGERLVQGSADLEMYLEELEKTLERWRQFQTDACYIDDDGNVC